MKKMVLVGTGSLAVEVADSLSMCEDISAVIIGDEQKVGDKICRLSVIGTLNDFEELHKKGYEYAFIAIEDNEQRKDLFNTARTFGYSLDSIIDQSAIIANSDTRIGENVYLGKKVVVNADTSIKDGVIVNTAAIIQTQCTIRSFSTISIAATIDDSVTIGENCIIGIRSIIGPGVSIEDNKVIGDFESITKSILYRANDKRDSE